MTCALQALLSNRDVSAAMIYAHVRKRDALSLGFYSMRLADSVGDRSAPFFRSQSYAVAANQARNAT